MIDQRIVRLRTEDMAFFKELDPFEMAIVMETPGGFALGVLTDENGNTEPSALLLGTVEKERISIDWMAVTAERRSKGIGEGLLRTVFEMAYTAGIDTVSVLIGEEYQNEYFSSGADSFFQERLFTPEGFVHGNAFFSLKELGKYDLFRQDVGKFPKTSSLSSFERGKMNDILGRIWKLWDNDDLVLRHYLRDCLDPFSSFVLMDRDEVCGALLVKNIGDITLPFFFFAESDNEGTALALGAFGAASAKYGKDREVFLICGNDAFQELYRQIFPEEGKTRVLSAKTAEAILWN